MFTILFDMFSLGINIGSVSAKFVYLNDNKLIFSKIIPHEGNIVEAVKHVFSNYQFSPDTKLMVTGNDGRFLINSDNVPEVVCIEKVLKEYAESYKAAVSMGGEDIIVYSCENNKIFDSISGNKCATGTGEFFKQQLGRMNLKLDDLKNASLYENCKAQKLSKRCSVFMKSDCTHRLNKKQASKGDIVLSLCNVMASKISEYLQKAGIKSGKVLLFGGLTQNPYIINYLKEFLPEVEFCVSEKSTILEAYGAALMARENNNNLIPPPDKLFRNQNIKFKRYPKLISADNYVSYIPEEIAKLDKNAEYALGIDGGSTTTKACLVNIETKEIVAHYYNRTHGDPVSALVKCINEIIGQVEQQISLEELKISLISTTGSSREILGVFTKTDAIYNEILAHSTATSHYCKDVDTIFEIGGQDAKYISLKNKVAVDYAMNEACSAGTGSFLEEAASGDLNITDVSKIGDIAAKSNAPIKFSEHCSAFINAEIRKAGAQGSSIEDITAGLVVSIVSNYLNRVVGNRNIGNTISVQGGVAKNSAVPLAFATLLKKKLIVPPMPELLGCFGAALIAIDKLNDNEISAQNFSLKKIINTSFEIEKYITCKACENLCSIANINIDGKKKLFGGRCSKYTVIKKDNKNTNAKNHIAEYRNMLFSNPETHQEKPTTITVGIPNCFSVYSLFPLYNKFFRELNIKPVLSDKVPEEGVSRVESDYCFPAEIAHGAVLDIIKKETDYIFIPHFKEKFDEFDDYNHSCTCPITQALPYYIKKAFPEINEKRLLAPEISYGENNKQLIRAFIEIGKITGATQKEAKSAILKAIEYQQEFDKKIINYGQSILNEIDSSEEPVIMLMGRPYNSFTKDANMGIPDKFVGKGVSVVPFSMFVSEKQDLYENMYWYYGRHIIKSALLAAKNKNIYPVFITNFSCAPDSFLLHYVSRIMNTKPFLILELDSHSADAGIDTRIEAFLDIVENYHFKHPSAEEKQEYDNGLRFISDGNKKIFIKNIHNNKKIEIKNNPKVKMLLSNMGKYSTEMVSAFIRQYGVSAYTFPVADEFTIQTAKDVCSGKECLPSHLVLGNFLQFLNSPEFNKDNIYMLFVPTTTGPCRTGQYFVFYQQIISDLKLDNVVVFTLDSDNSYNELGQGFSKKAWTALVIADYFKDIENSLRTCAKDKNSAMKIFEENWNNLVNICEKENTKSIFSELNNIAERLSKIPLSIEPEKCKKVLMIGEIYVRRDDFAVNELIDHFADKGVICKISGITEWIYYCDYVRYSELFGNNKSIFEKNYSGQIIWKIESSYKHNIENKVRKALEQSGLLIDFPHDMNKIMQNCKDQFIDNELYSEISISGGMAFTSLQEGYSGVINISPFACLIGRVIEGIVKPWARRNKKPLISIEVDGNPLPLNTLNKIDAFTMGVLRDKK